jgi:cephalosporin-C deacetylase-like acetyl esterase
MNRPVLLAIVCFVGFLAMIFPLSNYPANAETAAELQADSLKPFMKRKLELAKNVIEAIALEDHEKLAKNAQGLSLLSMESGWNVFTTNQYAQHSTDFRRAVQVVIDGAHEKNIDRAALGYVNMTLQCVECHKYMRKHHPNVKAVPSDK